jgi:hypothetical protein
MNIQEKERELRKYYGEENIDRFLEYLFEYAVQESEFFQLRTKCQSAEEYSNSLRIMCKAVRSEGINDAYELVKKLNNLYPRGKCKIEFSYDRIQAVIHQKWNDTLKNERRNQMHQSGLCEE